MVAIVRDVHGSTVEQLCRHDTSALQCVAAAAAAIASQGRHQQQAHAAGGNADNNNSHVDDAGAALPESTGPDCTEPDSSRVCSVHALRPTLNERMNISFINTDAIQL